MFAGLSACGRSLDWGSLRGKENESGGIGVSIASKKFSGRGGEREGETRVSSTYLGGVQQAGREPSSSGR